MYHAVLWGNRNILGFACCRVVSQQHCQGEATNYQKTKILVQRIAGLGTRNTQRVELLSKRKAEGYV